MQYELKDIGTSPMNCEYVSKTDETHMCMFRPRILLPSGLLPSALALNQIHRRSQELRERRIFQHCCCSMTRVAGLARYFVRPTAGRELHPAPKDCLDCYCQYSTNGGKINHHVKNVTIKRCVSTLCARKREREAPTALFIAFRPNATIMSFNNVLTDREA